MFLLSALMQLGLQTPAGFLLGGQPAQAEKQAQTPRTFHSIGTVANAAMRLRKAAAAASARQVRDRNDYVY